MLDQLGHPTPPPKIQRNWFRFVWLFGGLIVASVVAVWWAQSQLKLGTQEMRSSMGSLPGKLGLGGSQSEDLQPSADETVYEHEGQRFVLIQGKYYKYDPSHVYNVNGEKVFFQDNGTVWYRPPAPATEEDEESPQPSQSGQRVLGAQHAKVDFPEPSLKVYTPQGFNDLANSVAKAKSQVEKHNRELKQSLKNVDR